MMTDDIDYEYMTQEEWDDTISSFISFNGEHQTVHDLGHMFLEEGTVDTIEEGFAKAEQEIEDWKNR